MSNHFKKIIIPSDDLLGKIMARIKREERFLAFRNVIFFSIGALISFIVFFPALGALRAELSRSGSLQYLSLIFSDTGTVIAYWSDFSSSILESLPVLTMAAFLATILVFLGSLKFLIRNIGDAVFRPGKMARPII